MNAYRADHVCPPVRMIQLENLWMDFDDICHGCYAIGGHPKLVFFNFVQSVIPTWQMHELLR
jgi:hypothetical protein